MPAFWIDAVREPLSALQVTIVLLRAIGAPERFGFDLALDLGSISDALEALELPLSESPGARDGFVLVIDDLGESIGPESAAEFSLLAKCLRAHGCRLVVTTRSVGSWQAKGLCDYQLIGPDDTRLTAEEACGVHTSSGLDLATDQALELHEVCNGHVAYFRILLSQAAVHGADSACTRIPTLDAWLGRSMECLMQGPQSHALTMAVLLKGGAVSDLAGVVGAQVALTRIAEVLPLVTVSGPGGSRFRVHDLVDGYHRDHVAPENWCGGSATAVQVLEVLSNREDYTRACEILCRLKSGTATLEWLDRYGERALLSGGHQHLADLMDTLPLSDFMGRPSLLLLWADLCCEMGHTEDAFAKSRAARSLASHDDSEIRLRAMTQGAFYLRRLGRLAEADALAQEVLEMPASRRSNRYRAESLFCIGHNHLIRGAADRAWEPLQAARELAESDDTPDLRFVLATRQALALVPALSTGDFMTSMRMMTPMFEAEGIHSSARLMLKGNAAICLVEVGRVRRGESLAAFVVRETQERGLTMYTGAYLPALACVRFARGEIDLGLESMAEAVRHAVEASDEPSAAQARVYLAIILRAAGRLDESLTEAERAFERLSVNDTMQFRRLAALEVAASLLALGDASAARTWTESVVMEGFSGNSYHALRADMILAEVERQNGEVDAAVERIATHKDYVLSENPNWQIAMYCRSFPGLLGVVAAAVYPEPVPAHLLRMILPEHSEQCLRAARDTLSDAQFRDLGERLVGADEFAAYLQRDGLPLCHVRLFGGLELSIGGRAVRERDWRKRKARLLFAMLAIRRGQDVPRDQLFEYLWPEMDVERAKNNLYVVWSTMKAALVGEADKGAPCPYIESVGGVCRTVRDAVRTDVDEFENLLIAAREAEAAGQPSTALRAYERIADLYRGDLLPGDVYDDWFATLRDHYRSSFVDAMLRATALLMTADDPGNAIIYARRAIQSDPFREDLFQAALRCQIAAGQRSSAIDTYFQCRDNLAEELGLDPSVETRALYDQILAMEDRPRPAPFDPLL